MRTYSRKIKKDQVHGFMKMQVTQVDSIRKFQRWGKKKNQVSKLYIVVEGFKPGHPKTLKTKKE